MSEILRCADHPDLRVRLAAIRALFAFDTAVRRDLLARPVPHADPPPPHHDPAPRPAGRGPAPLGRARPAPPHPPQGPARPRGPGRSGGAAADRALLPRVAVPAGGPRGAAGGPLPRWP